MTDVAGPISVRRNALLSAPTTSMRVNELAVGGCRAYASGVRRGTGGRGTGDGGRGARDDSLRLILSLRSVTNYTRYPSPSCDAALLLCEREISPAVFRR